MVAAWKNKKLSQSNNKSSKSYFYPILGIIGIVFVILGGGYLTYRKTILSFQTDTNLYEFGALNKNVPSHIDIPSSGISIPIRESIIENGVWQTSESGASHLAASAGPGQSGNIVIYGHNYWSIFGGLTKTKPGDMILITTDQGQKFAYRVTETKTVTPDRIEEISPTLSETLTVYTCTGFLDLNRFIVHAIPLLSASAVE